VRGDPHAAPGRTKFVILIGIIVFAVISYGIYLSKTNLVLFEESFVREDGWVEWLTVVALVCASFICLYRIPILKPFRSKLFILSLALQAVVFLFGAGEEISWGQRIFNISPGEFFQTNNAQGETNLHNLIIKGKSVNKLLFGTILGILIAIYFLVLPLLYVRVERAKSLINQYAIALPHWWHVVFYLVLMGMIQVAQGHRTGELVEFAGAWIFVMVLLVPLNKEVFSRMLLAR
jgi:hypothetical protein